jgi:hypothetical protein
MDVSKDSLIPLLRDFFKAIPDCGIKTLVDTRRVSVLVDNTYSVLKKAEIMGMLKSSPLLAGAAEGSENSELFDCDDYALQLKASLTALFRTKRLLVRMVAPPAIGVVITQNHALNIVLCESNDAGSEILLVDPSLKSPKMVSDPSASSELLKTLPISLIYI